jgi:hypothetical protein
MAFAHVLLNTQLLNTLLLNTLLLNTLLLNTLLLNSTGRSREPKPSRAASIGIRQRHMIPIGVPFVTL